MYRFALWLLVCMPIWSHAQTWNNQILKERAAKDSSFHFTDESPLLPADKSAQKKLNYYPPDSSWVITGSVTWIKKPQCFLMRTSTARKPEYCTVATFQFERNNTQFTLPMYQLKEEIRPKATDFHVFMPFVDQTSGAETYGGGRYLDVTMPNRKTQTLVIDFNGAYNPYCAYNERYSCPIPPEENVLDLEIKVGEKVFKEH